MIIGPNPGITRTPWPTSTRSPQPAERDRTHSVVDQDELFIFNVDRHLVGNGHLEIDMTYRAQMIVSLGYTTSTDDADLRHERTRLAPEISGKMK